jgi:serine/threonine protein kinase
MAKRPLPTSHLERTDYEFQLDVHIRKKRQKPLFRAFGKSIYEVEWIDRDGPSILLLKIDGAKARQEASFYVNLSCHPHIVRTFGLVQSNPSSVMLLQEFALSGDLSDRLQEGDFKPTEQVLCEIFAQICDAMIFLAVNGIVHGDLACRNVLVFQSDPSDPKKNLVKLTDFGLTRASSLYAVVDSPTRTTMTIIPLRYAAPELLRNTTSLNYSEKSDIFSMGVLMWEACSYGELPYSSLEIDDDVLREKLNDRRLSRPKLCSDQQWTIINECWHQNPGDRPDFERLKKRLKPISSNLDKRKLSFCD